MFKFIYNLLNKQKKEVNQDTIPLWFKNNYLYYEKSFLLKDMTALELYGGFLRHAGHCPECNDLLFVDIEEDWISSTKCYKVIKFCLNRDCDYEKDVSKDFNSNLGIDYTIELINNPIEFKQEMIPSSTGHLRSSFDKEVSRNAFGVLTGFDHNKEFHKRLVVIDTKLPKPSKETMKSVYCIYDDGLAYKLYDTYYSYRNKEYSWMEIDEGEVDLSKYFISEQEYQDKMGLRMRKVCK